ncbi:MAG: hypothetical protein K2W96_15550 [Gemmataceae bacterium]|nr:hypothetical protein [Gemmataceae bacterium]
MTNVTFGKLDRMLRGLGFTASDTPTGTRVYQHAPSGAEVYLPRQDAGQLVKPHHVLTAQVALDDFGVLAERDFEARLQTAG